MKTNFFLRVYTVVKQIPHGKVATYGQIATSLGCPNCSRQVGWALHANPDPKNIPCHRVVNRHGEVCKGFVFGGLEEQRKLLEGEGIVFEKNGAISLLKYQWKPQLIIEI